MTTPKMRADEVRPGMTVGIPLVVGTVTDVEQSFTGEVRIRFAVTFGGMQTFEIVVHPDTPVVPIRPT